MTDLMEKQRKYAHWFDTAANIFKTAGIAALLILSYLQSASNGEVAHRIVDCTDPKGTCFRESQQRTGAAVVQISDIAKYAAICADRHGSITAEEMDDCIQEQMRNKK